MNYIVSGATGFIGTNLIKTLLQDVSSTVYALVCKSEKVTEVFFSKNNFIPIICDLEKDDNDFSKISDKIDVFFHFAWIGVHPEQRKDFEVQIRNIKITENCLRLAKVKNAKRFVSPGSTNEYLYSGKIINKNSVPSPKDSYGAVKVALRYLQNQFLQNESIDFLYVIIAGIYSEYRRDNNVISYTIQKLLQNKSPRLTKCEQLWDYVHIDDVVEALLAVSQKGKSGVIYAIGHGDNCPLRNYIEIIHRIINPSVQIDFGAVSYQSEILPSSCIDLTDLIEDTGFCPKIDFETGITRVINNWE